MYSKTELTIKDFTSWYSENRDVVSTGKVCLKWSSIIKSGYYISTILIHAEEDKVNNNRYLKKNIINNKKLISDYENYYYLGRSCSELEHLLVMITGSVPEVDLYLLNRTPFYKVSFHAHNKVEREYHFQNIETILKNIGYTSFSRVIGKINDYSYFIIAKNEPDLRKYKIHNILNGNRKSKEYHI